MEVSTRQTKDCIILSYSSYFCVCEQLVPAKDEAEALDLRSLGLKADKARFALWTQWRPSGPNRRSAEVPSEASPTMKTVASPIPAEVLTTRAPVEGREAEVFGMTIGGGLGAADKGLHLPPR